eukprot:s671_g11.t1
MYSEANIEQMIQLMKDGIAGDAETSSMRGSSEFTKEECAERSKKQLHSTLTAMRTAIQRGFMNQVEDSSPATWNSIPQAEQLKRDLVDACEACGEIVGSTSEGLRHLILAGVKAIFSTTTVAGRNMVWQQHIPNVIVDEACQARELEGMVALNRLQQEGSGDAFQQVALRAPRYHWAAKAYIGSTVPNAAGNR